MIEELNQLKKRIAPAEPYWYLITLFWLFATAVFITHLRSGVTPDRVAIHIAVFDFDIFWYGILIVSGIALGAYVVSRLVMARALTLFDEHVPTPLQQKPVTELHLPDEIRASLVQRKLVTVGDLLLQMGFDARHLGLNRAGVKKVRESVQRLPGVKATWLTDAPWRPWNPEHVWNGVIWCLILGLIGARLYHVLTPSPSMAAVGIESPLDYFRNPYRLIDFRGGGLGIYGGIAGGALGLFLYARRQRLPTIAWADLAVVGVALGQAIGRWGNFFNQELYGRPPDLPSAVQIDSVYRLPGYGDASHFHPAFLYESLWNFLAFVILLTLTRRYSDKLLTGELTALYLILYGIGRILLETVRLDSRTISLGILDLNMAVATLVSLLVALIMAAWIAQRRWRLQA
jgi:phosphatidylglycerol:prolipoprotein diacylglycerol transferase